MAYKTTAKLTVEVEIRGKHKNDIAQCLNKIKKITGIQNFKITQIDNIKEIFVPPKGGDKRDTAIILQQFVKECLKEIGVNWKCHRGTTVEWVETRITVWTSFEDTTLEYKLKRKPFFRLYLEANATVKFEFYKNNYTYSSIYKKLLPTEHHLLANPQLKEKLKNFLTRGKKILETY